MEQEYTDDSYTPPCNDLPGEIQWEYTTVTSSSSPFQYSSQSPAKRLWPFEGDHANSGPSTPPNLRPPTSEENEPINGDGVRICFGSITDVKAQMTVRDCPTLVAYNGAYCCDIMKEGAYFSLNYNEVNFARLKKGLCGALNKVVADRELTLRAFIEPDELASIKNASYYNKKETFSLEINIYGLELDIDEVGRILSGDNIYLQFPRFGLGGYTYQNPHFLPIEGFSGAVPDTSSDPNQEENREENNRLQNSSSEASGAVSTTVDNILDAELTHHVDLGQISVDSRIKQTLRPHQIEAIDFISQRETGNLDSKLSLWKYNDVDQDEPFYQHVFTGAKRRNRMETKGGIIADEMGLGKTLVVLSTIAGTFDRAKKFVAENQPEEGQTLRKIPSQATLVIAPSSLLVDSWQSEIYKHTYPGAITFHKHLGPGRHGERHFLQQKMIVFTTYATVAIEHGRQKADSPLASINWFRIVLDEAHDIRNPTTKQFKAVSALTAQHRWCLTGTPIQNSLDDLGALSTFLKVPILESVPTFAKIIKNPVNTNAPNRFENLRVLLKTICLRRTRELLELPEPITTIRRVPLTNSEKAEYDDLLLQGQCSINMAVSGRRKARINSTVLEALLKLRLFCNNGKDFGNMPSGNRGIPEDPDEAIAYLQQLGQDICAYCNGAIYSLTEFEDTEGGKFIAKCPHLVCQNCLPQHREQNMQCPTCAVDDRNGTTELAQSSSSLSTTHLDRSDAARPYPSKLLALLRDLRGDRENKSIVFSCWKKTLSIVATLLKHYRIPYNMIDGSLALNGRLKELDDFRSLTGPNILLMTLGTGAVGLNLASATRIYLLEPQWNPSIESQAIGRALRLGQTEQVKITRYIMANTVEEGNVLDRQKRKLQLAGCGFGKGKDVAAMALDIFHIPINTQVHRDNRL